MTPAFRDWLIAMQRIRQAGGSIAEALASVDPETRRRWFRREAARHEEWNVEPREFQRDEFFVVRRDGTVLSADGLAVEAFIRNLAREGWFARKPW